METGTKLRKGAELRLEFIEFRLFWEGRVNRSDITSRFGVSVPLASNDLTRYQELAPANIQYDASEKCYVPAETFIPKFLKPNAGRYLSQLRAVADAVIDIDDTWMAELPATGTIPIPSRRVEPALLRALVRAVRRRRSLDLHYHSMSQERPESVWRRITPHAFGFDGLRWHVRAYCHIRQQFRDFLLSRCLGVGEEGEPGTDPSADYNWVTSFDVILTPNPLLSPAQQQTIGVDYGMTDGRIIVPVRRALLYYFNKRLRLDVAKHLDRPEETPVVIENREDYDNVLAEVTA
ncbi:hypothetical protein GALL_244550 [mine drainage metagenome]|uniref:Uncharacterized protein n=1 Tax=mine drainage metagenome TaxID=410659 RepID=A0A1J5RNS2_9ZZZZ